MVTVVIDEVSYEIPEAVEVRMREYYEAMQGLDSIDRERVKHLREVARLETLSRKKGATKEDRLRAHYAKKELLNLYR